MKNLLRIILLFIIAITFINYHSTFAAGSVSYISNGPSEHYVYVDGNMVSRGGHSFTYTTTSEPSCTSKGYGTKTCTECGYSATYSIAKTGHSADSDYDPPTCTQPGYYYSYCTVCGSDLGSHSIPPAGHTPSSTWQTSATQHWKLCSVCGAIATTKEDHYDNDEDCYCDACNYYTAFPVTKLSVSSIAAVVYNGSAYTPTPEVREGTKVLKLNTDYTLTYSNNVNAGTATITLRGQGDYGGKRDINFTIKPKSIEGSNTTITINPTSYVFDGNQKTPSVTVKDVARNKTLTMDSDYTRVYGDNISGTGRVSVNGINNYTGNVSINFVIEDVIVYVATGDNGHNVYINDNFSHHEAHENTYSVITQPTCSNYGSGKNKCNLCGYESVKRIEKVAHTETSSTTPATCTEPGYKRVYCSVCETDLGSYTIPATGHTPKSTWETTETQHWKLCRVCEQLATTKEEHSDANSDGYCDVCNYFSGIPVSTLTVASIPDVIYKGSAHTPTPQVKDGNKVLTINTDYTLTYSNNINAGVATITLKGKGNYGGTRAFKFNIRQKSIADGNTNITLSQTTYTYDGNAKTPSVTVKDIARNLNLTNNTDYTFSFNNNTNAGTANVSVVGKGNYTGNVLVNFTINKKSVAVPTYADKTYNGNVQSISALATGYKFSGGTTSATNVGTYTTTAVLDSNYIWNDNTVENKTITWKILPRTMASNVSAILNETVFTYDGTLKKPGVTVHDNPYNKDLTENVHYKLTYTENVNVGTGKVKVEGINNYSGELNLTFTIQKAQGILTLSKSSTSINALASDSITYTYNGDGTVQVTSEDNSIAQVEISQTRKTITVTGVKSGTVNVTVFALASDNYLATSNQSIAITVLDDVGPETITATGANNGDNVTLTIYAKDTGSGISAISVNGANIGITQNNTEGSATGTKLLTAGGIYEIAATDTNGNVSKITVHAYEINYNANGEGATGTMTKQIKYQDLDRPLKSCNFTRSGNDFKSWNTAANGRGVSYAAGNNFAENMSVTMYVQWGPKIYTATFYCDYGSGNQIVEQRSYAYGSLISVPDDQQIPSEEGTNGKTIIYKQKGWNAEKVDDSALETPERITETNRNNIHMIDSDVNYYATFTSSEFSNTDATVVLESKSKLTGSYVGLRNVEGLAIIGEGTNTSTRPIVKGTSLSIENDNGLVLLYLANLQGPTLGTITNK